MAVPVHRSYGALVHRVVILSVVASFCAAAPVAAAATTGSVSSDDGTSFRLELTGDSPLDAEVRCFDRLSSGELTRPAQPFAFAAGEEAGTAAMAPAPGAVRLACRVSGGDVPGAALAFGATRFTGPALALRATGTFAVLAAPPGAGPVRTVTALRRALPGQPVRVARTLADASSPGTLYVLSRASRPGSLALALPLGRAAVLLRGAPGQLPAAVVAPRGPRIEIGTALTVTGGTDDEGNPLPERSTETP